MPGSGPTSPGAPGDELREVAGLRLLRRVGEGGMSCVYLGYDVAGGNSVALKLLADHLAHSREFVSRFYREARLSRLLTHANLVQGMAAGFDPVAGKHYLVLEFIDGPTAHTVLSRAGRFAPGEAVQIGIHIARALAFLHARQYVHRDVKPDNILLHPEGVAKLADLGLAKRLNDDQQITATHNGVGTSYYMAYEQALNADLVDGRSDIFALGATLYHLLTGQVPFPGPTHEEVVRGKELDQFRPLRELNPGVPAGLARIIEATLARDPRARIQSADELAAALESTNLASRIPPYSQTGTTADGRQEPEAPTRADLPVRATGNPDTPIDPPQPGHSQEPPPSSATAPPRRGGIWPVLRMGLGAGLFLTLTYLAAAAVGIISIRQHWEPLPEAPVPAAEPAQLDESTGGPQRPDSSHPAIRSVGSAGPPSGGRRACPKSFRRSREPGRA